MINWIGRGGGIIIILIWSVEGINSIGRSWQSRENEDFQSPNRPYLQSPNQAKFAPLLCVYWAPTRHYSIPHQINTFWHLYSVKIKQRRLKFHSSIHRYGGSHLFSLSSNIIASATQRLSFGGKTVDSTIHTITLNVK